MTEIKLMSTSEALAKRLAEDPELAALEAERDALLDGVLRITPTGRLPFDGWHTELQTERDALRAENERLKQSMVDHFKNEHLAGDGPEIDRWKAEVAKLKADEQWLAVGREYREHRLLAACQSLHKRWKAAKAP